MQNQYTSKYISNFIQTSMIILICISSLTLLMFTEQQIHKQYFLAFSTFELFSSFIFAIEFLIRIYLAYNSQPHNDLHNHHILSFKFKHSLYYIVSFMGFIDLFSFLPSLFYYLHLTDTQAILLLQLCRLFKLTRYFPAFNMLIDVLRYETESLTVSVVLMFIVVIFASVGIYIFEHKIQPDVFGSIPRSMWWAIVTLTTVGYGDVTPITPAGKIFATFITLAGVGLVSLPAGIIASGFTEQLRIRRKRFEMEVEQLLNDDGELSRDDLSKLEHDRKILGLDKAGADLIISQIQRSASKK